MASRITRKNLHAQIDTLNGIAMRRQFFERYELSVCSPGDGTRYQLIAQPYRHEASQLCTASEMYDILYTLIRVLERI